MTSPVCRVVFSPLSGGVRRDLRRTEPRKRSSPDFREGLTWVPVLTVLPTAVGLWAGGLTSLNSFHL